MFPARPAADPLKKEEEAGGWGPSPLRAVAALRSDPGGESPAPSEAAGEELRAPPPPPGAASASGSGCGACASGSGGGSTNSCSSSLVGVSSSHRMSSDSGLQREPQQRRTVASTTKGVSAGTWCSITPLGVLIAMPERERERERERAHDF